LGRNAFIGSAETKGKNKAPTRWFSNGGKLLRAFALLVAFGLMALIAIRWNSYQWDFHMFYGSATDFLQGTSPYRGKGLSFYHPPLTLYLYGLFAQLPRALAYEL
jgi:hypothetical protein